MVKFMRFSMTINLTMATTLNHMLKLTTKQWSRFMSNKDRWMGVFYQDEDSLKHEMWQNMT